MFLFFFFCVVGSVSKQPQMQGLSLEDDMVDGDLGDGTELRKTHSSSSRKTQSLGGLTEGTLSQTKLGCCNSEEAMAWISKSQQKASWKIPHCGENFILYHLLDCLAVSHTRFIH